MFADFNLARTLILTLRESDRRGATGTMSLVVIPDHLHWLFTLRASTLSAVVRTMKSSSAMQINRLRATRGQALWQRGFHDHGVRQEDDLLALARYVVANPKRAGLVDSVAQSPHWHSAWL